MTPQAEVYVSIGSNIDPELHIPQALTLLAEQVRLDGVSTFYRSAPLKRPEQPFYLNGAARIYTALSPKDLKYRCLRPLEERLGRVRTSDKYAARIIDLDIALYDHMTIHEPDLEIPDPDIRERPCLAVPLLELAPEAVLPDTGEALVSIVHALDGSELAPDEAFTATLRARLPL